MANKGFFKSYLKEVNKDLRKGTINNLRNASRHMTKKIKRKLNKKGKSSPGQPPSRQQGNLRKGIGYKLIVPPANVPGDSSSIVGASRPAQHFHLMELGTKNRKQKSTGKSTGKVKPHPVLVPTFREEANAVKKIMGNKIL